MKLHYTTILTLYEASHTTYLVCVLHRDIQFQKLLYKIFDYCDRLFSFVYINFQTLDYIKTKIKCHGIMWLEYFMFTSVWGKSILCYRRMVCHCHFYGKQAAVGGEV